MYFGICKRIGCRGTYNNTDKFNYFCSQFCNNLSDGFNIKRCADPECRINISDLNIRSLYCSDICRRKMENIRLGKGKKYEKNLEYCLQCDTNMEKGNHGKKFCDSICRSIYNHRNINKNKTGGKHESKNFLLGEFQRRGGKCEKDGCEIKDFDLIEIDHINRQDKKGSLSRSWNIEFTKQEIKICQFLCGIHHREKTYEEDLLIRGKSPTNKYYIRGDNFINNWKINQKCCQHCKKQITLENVRMFDCDHKNRIGKLYNINMMKKHSLNKIRIELEKCWLLCIFCHKKKTINEERTPRIQNNENIERNLDFNWDWKEITEEADEDFINNHPTYKFHWSVISNKSWLTWKVLLRNQNWPIKSSIISGREFITEKLIDDYPNFNWDFKKISGLDFVDQRVFEKYYDYYFSPNGKSVWDSKKISKKEWVTEDIINKYILFPWNFESITDKDWVTEDIINKYPKVGWDWNVISDKEWLNEEVILRNFGWKYNFKIISEKEYMSIKLYNSFLYEDWNYKELSKRKFMNERVIEFMLNEDLDWDEISQKDWITKELIKRNSHWKFNYNIICNRFIGYESPTNITIENLQKF